jgi:hypothetical protein
MIQVLAGPPLDLGVAPESGELGLGELGSRELGSRELGSRELGSRELGPRELGSGDPALRPLLALGSEPDSLASRLPGLDPEEMPADPLPTDPLSPDPEEVDLDATVIEERSSRLR